jgi:dienelactone hydrolase
MRPDDSARPSFPAVRVPPFPAPRTLPEWEARRRSARATLRSLLGALPARSSRPGVQVTRVESKTGYRLEKLRFDNGAGAQVPAWMLIPDGPGPFPGILYCHWHAGQYGLGKDEIWLPAPDGSGTRGESLVRQGYAVLAADAYGFGERSGLGPDGPGQTGAAEETSLSKVFLWMGRTLWGMMVRDDELALDILAQRPEVDPLRLGATGISMGSTRTWWLAALDDRVASSVGVCCLTRYQDLITSRALAEHGIYYFVPGMLSHFDTEAVLSLIAPRPFLALSGAQDPGSPASGVEKISEFCAAVYRLYGKAESFKSVLYPGVGHVYTSRMWDEMIGWFGKTLNSRP